MLLARRTSTLSALPNDVISNIECGQLHSELFGHRHSTLQSHGLFALARHLQLLVTNIACLPFAGDIR